MIIETKNLTKRYGQITAVDNLSLKIKEGEVFGLITSFIIFPLFFLSGSLYPVENLPGWMTVFVRIDPVTYAVDALREVILGITNFGVLTDMAILIVFSITMIGIGTIAFNRMKL